MKTCQSGLHQFEPRKTKAGCPDCQRIYNKTWSKANRDKKNLYGREYRAVKKDHCEKCGFKAEHSCQLDVDHVDGNHNNNDISNLMTLCANCHRFKSYLFNNKGFNRWER